MNNNTMNNDNNTTMNDSSNDSTMDNKINSSKSILLAEDVVSTPPAQQHRPGTSSALYKLAARNLREYHGVPSMTALKLEKTVALLGLPPSRIVVQGLAPRRLLKGGDGGSSPLVLAGESSAEVKEGLNEAEMMDDNLEDNSNSTYDDNGDGFDNTAGDPKVEGFEADGDSNGNGKSERPIHAALVAGGVNLQPRETRPLLRALGVSPNRLVKLGLVKREALLAVPLRRGGGPGRRVLCADGPGQGGMGRPRGPHHGPPGALRCCGPRCGDPSRATHGPPYHPCRGAGHRAMHPEKESGEEGVSAPLGPHGGPGHHGPRHQGGRLQGPPNGPGHRSMRSIGQGRGPLGGAKHGHGHRHHPHGHRHPPLGHGRGHCSGDLQGECEGEEDEHLHGRAGGPGQHGLRRRHGGGMGRPRGPPHAPPHVGDDCGPSPPHPFHGAGHHTMPLGEESEEEALHGGPGHRGPRHPRGGGRMGTGRSRGHPQGTPHGPFHGLFHEDSASGAPPGMMANPRYGSPSRGGCGMQQRGGMHGGGMGYCSGGGRGGVGGGAGDWQHRRMAHLAHFDGVKQRGGMHGGGMGYCGGGGYGGGDWQHNRRMAHLVHFGGRHQPQLEAY